MPVTILKPPEPESSMDLVAKRSVLGSIIPIARLVRHSLSHTNLLTSMLGIVLPSFLTLILQCLACRDDRVLSILHGNRDARKT